MWFRQPPRGAHRGPERPSLALARTLLDCPRNAFLCLSAWGRMRLPISALGLLMHTPAFGQVSNWPPADLRLSIWVLCDTKARLDRLRESPAAGHKSERLCFRRGSRGGANTACTSWRKVKTPSLPQEQLRGATGSVALKSRGLFALFRVCASRVPRNACWSVFVGYEGFVWWRSLHSVYTSHTWCQRLGPEETKPPKRVRRCFRRPPPTLLPCSFRVLQRPARASGSFYSASYYLPDYVLYLETRQTAPRSLLIHQFLKASALVAPGPHPTTPSVVLACK